MNNKEIININSVISDVTVYLSGAQITRKATVQLESGNTMLKFDMLPMSLIPDSIQVIAEEGVTIQSVEHKINYLVKAKNTDEIEKLKHELENQSDKKTYEQSLLKLCDQEEQFLLSNRSLAGSYTGIKTLELKSAAEFFSTSMENINKKRIEINKAITKLDDEIRKISNELGVYSSPESTPVSEIIVKVCSENRKTALSLSYYVNDAGWTPLYDIRAKDIDSDIQLGYKANVFQNTNEDWQNVMLTLSTANPSHSGICPELKPWYINFEMPVMRNQYRASNNMVLAKMSMDSIKASEPQASYDESVEAAPNPVTEINESMTSIEYSISVPANIASGKDPQNVDIIIHSLPAKYHYFSVCKLDKEVYLLAKIKDWENLNLIAGEASIFFKNRYIGKTFIDPRRAEEEIEFSLGTDKSVIVKRTRGKDYTAKGIVLGNTKNTREWLITVRNLKSNAIDIKILDQVPISINNQIQVEVQEISNAEYNKETGILTWNLNLAPASSKSMTIKYTVAHPRDKIVLLE
ncbi:MAG: mucoidy inhibitor MuiA family protein [Oscillospiraceae bacterium]|nr:mucoidy inhibitor MuiA family protein [Oscillospiraceae bacterium]